MSCLQTLDRYNFSDGGFDCYYHTAKASNALDTLTNQRLFPSKPSDVNDPKDMTIDFSGRLSTWQDIPFPSRGAAKQTEKRIAAKFKDKKCLDDKIGFVCMALSSAVDKSKAIQHDFWMGYAGKYAGVRMKFHVDANLFSCLNSRDVWCGKINYGKRNVVVRFCDLKSWEDVERTLTKGDFMQRFCFSKETSWKREHEFRMGTIRRHLTAEFSEIRKRQLKFFKFNIDHLREIVVGDAADAVCTQELQTFAEKNGIAFGIQGRIKG